MLFIGVTSRQAKPNPSGFTIFELMVVLVILAILSTVALPNLLSGMRREQLAATSLEIVNWLERARNQAVKDMETCKLSITADDASNASIAITPDSPGCSNLQRFSISDHINISSDLTLLLSDNSDIEFSLQGKKTTPSHEKNDTKINHKANKTNK